MCRWRAQITLRDATASVKAVCFESFESVAEIAVTEAGDPPGALGVDIEKWQDETEQPPQHTEEGGSKEYERYLQGGGGSLPQRARERITGTGTHISISLPAEEGGMPDASATRHLKAGRSGPIHRGGRIPTPLYDSISVQTFAKPLSMKRAPV